MRLFYWQVPDGNFGDDLNAWLWDALLPGWRGWDDAVTLVGVGTLLNDGLRDRFAGARVLVAGSGAGYGGFAGPLPPAWDVRAVRGPRSAAALGLPPGRGIVDPAVMVARLPEFARIAAARGPGARPLFVPHHASAARHDWAALCARAGIDHISPGAPSKDVIAALAGASLVLAESMHAAIIADAFRVPWVPVAISSAFNGAKWLDWGDSLGLAFATPPLFPLLAGTATRVPASQVPPSQVPPSQVRAPHAALPASAALPAGGARKPPLRYRLRLAAERLGAVGAFRRALARPAHLSDAAVLGARMDAYAAVLDGIRRDYAGG